MPPGRELLLAQPVSFSSFRKHSPLSLVVKYLKIVGLYIFIIMLYIYLCFPGGLAVKDPPVNAGNRYLGQEDPLEKEMATQSSILAWRIPWTEEPGRL